MREAAATGFVNSQGSLTPVSERVKQRPGRDGVIEFVPQICACVDVHQLLSSETDVLCDRVASCAVAKRSRSQRDGWTLSA